MPSSFSSDILHLGNLLNFTELNIFDEIFLDFNLKKFYKVSWRTSWLFFSVPQNVHMVLLFWA